VRYIYGLWGGSLTFSLSAGRSWWSSAWDYCRDAYDYIRPGQGCQGCQGLWILKLVSIHRKALQLSVSALVRRLIYTIADSPNRLAAIAHTDLVSLIILYSHLLSHYTSVRRDIYSSRKVFVYIIYSVLGAEVGLYTSPWERLGNLHSRANVETQGGRTPRAGEEQEGRKR
jgi:hypothetical protein